VHFTCEGATLSGTLYLPEGSGPHPAVIWILGANRPTAFPTGIWSGRSPGLGWGSSPTTNAVEDSPKEHAVRGTTATSIS
jgi:dipeptidyl aminopeptidase/acylaminoacyl peptidase